MVAARQQARALAWLVRHTPEPPRARSPSVRDAAAGGTAVAGHRSPRSPFRLEGRRRWPSVQAGRSRGAATSSCFHPARAGRTDWTTGTTGANSIVVGTMTFAGLQIITVTYRGEVWGLQTTCGSDS
jgi:hypothetical protein